MCLVAFSVALLVWIACLYVIDPPDGYSRAASIIEHGFVDMQRLRMAPTDNPWLRQTEFREKTQATLRLYEEACEGLGLLPAPPSARVAQDARTIERLRALMLRQRHDKALRDAAHGRLGVQIGAMTDSMGRYGPDVTELSRKMIVSPLATEQFRHLAALPSLERKDTRNSDTTGSTQDPR